MKSKLVIATFSSGSTYLQRSATVWLRELVDPAFTNPHELLNGLGVHPAGYLIKQWADVNSQSVHEIRHILEQNIRPIVARLSYDHVLLRKETAQELTDFYSFLREYFDVYVCRRDNLFDYGLCWAIRRCTDRAPEFQINNVHTPQDRATLYEQKKFTVDTALVPAQAHKYTEYLDWVKINFPDAIPVQYRDLESDIDQVLQELFPTAQTFAQKHGMGIAEFTRTGYLMSMGQLIEQKQLQTWHQINKMIQDFCTQQILLDPVPIKSTTMQDKINKISNFTECLTAYNNWATANSDVANQLTPDSLIQLAQQDNHLYFQK